MTEWNVFLVLVAVFGFVGTMYSMFYKPTNELKIELVKLNGNLEGLRTSDSHQNRRLDKHSSAIDDHEVRLTKIEISNQNKNEPLS